MILIEIAKHPSYWGYRATDAQSLKWFRKMQECARSAGFNFSHVESDGTTDAISVFFFGSWDDAEYANSRPYIGVDWFSRWCEHGFRGMTPWLKQQISTASAVR